MCVTAWGGRNLQRACPWASRPLSTRCGALTPQRPDPMNPSSPVPWRIGVVVGGLPRHRAASGRGPGGSAVCTPSLQGGALCAGGGGRARGHGPARRALCACLPSSEGRQGFCVLSTYCSYGVVFLRLGRAGQAFKTLLLLGESGGLGGEHGGGAVRARGAGGLMGPVQVAPVHTGPSVQVSAAVARGPGAAWPCPLQFLRLAYMWGGGGIHVQEQTRAP